MSELKSFIVLYDGKFIRAYEESEADKVIAKLKNEIEVQKRLRNMALASVPNALKVMKIIQHQKYKRCLAMAKWCRKFSKECALSACTHRGWLIERHFDNKAELYRKWHRRWLAIADKFKEAK